MNKACLALIAAVVLAVPGSAAASGGGGPQVRVFDGAVDDAPAAVSSRHDTAKNSVGNIR